MVPQNLLYCLLTSLDVGSDTASLSSKASPCWWGSLVVVISPLHRVCIQKDLPSSEGYLEKYTANYSDQTLGSQIKKRGRAFLVWALCWALFFGLFIFLNYVSIYFTYQPQFPFVSSCFFLLPPFYPHPKSISPLSSFRKCQASHGSQQSPAYRVEAGASSSPLHQG